MKSFDTNVAVRLVVEDDPAQCDRAARAFRQAIATKGVFFSATVLVEVAWVLRVAWRVRQVSNWCPSRNACRSAACVELRASVRSGRDHGCIAMIDAILVATEGDRST